MRVEILKIFCESFSKGSRGHYGAALATQSNCIDIFALVIP